MCLHCGQIVCPLDTPAFVKHSLHFVDLGIKAVFKQVAAQDHQKRMSAGMPDHLAIAVTELSENLYYGEKAFGDDKNLVRAQEVRAFPRKALQTPANMKQIIPSSYKLKSWEDYVKKEDWSGIL
jgi:hypothetical protein